MVTYGDMMTLLLCFFVLLFSFSTIDVVKFRNVIIELQGALGVLSGGPMVLNLGDIPARQITENPAADTRQMEQIEEAIEDKIEEEGLDGSIETSINERGLMIRFTDTALFDLGKADIKPGVVPVLDVIAQEISQVSNRVQVEGHTDPSPIHTAQFPSNWELSTARATAVIHYMIENGGISPHQLSAAGYAFYYPVVPNTTPENRAKNRRVDVIILNTEDPVFQPDLMDESENETTDDTGQEESETVEAEAPADVSPDPSDALEYLLSPESDGIITPPVDEPEADDTATKVSGNRQ